MPKRTVKPDNEGFKKQRDLKRYRKDVVRNMLEMNAVREAIESLGFDNKTREFTPAARLSIHSAFRFLRPAESPIRKAGHINGAFHHLRRLYGDEFFFTIMEEYLRENGYAFEEKEDECYSSPE